VTAAAADAPAGPAGHAGAPADAVPPDRRPDLIPAHIEQVISAARDFAIDPAVGYRALLARVNAAPLTEALPPDPARLRPAVPEQAARAAARRGRRGPPTTDGGTSRPSAGTPAHPPRDRPGRPLRPPLPGHGPAPQPGRSS